MKRQDATGSLELVRDFINTRDLELATDVLASPGAAAAWLVDHGLMGETASVTDAGSQRMLEVREALRALARCNSGAELPASAMRTLDQLAEEAGVRLRFRPDGGQFLAPHPDGKVQEALGLILAAVGQAALNGTWGRLKVCPAEDCLWAFYDHSKNKSGVWCQMGECGNRAKARRYRTRHGVGAPQT